MRFASKGAIGMEKGRHPKLVITSNGPQMASINLSPLGRLGRFRSPRLGQGRLQISADLDGQQTSAINASRAHLAEFGVTAAVGHKGIEELLRVIAERPTKVAAIALANRLAGMARAMMARGERYNYPASLRV
jgi:hypothetical protein